MQVRPGDLGALQTGPAVSICACRGVLARTHIPASKEALITLPSDLFFTPHAASVCLKEALSASSLEHIEVSNSTLFLKRPIMGRQRDIQPCCLQRMGGDTLTMAIALAHERSKQQSSFWAPYIATLPKKPGPAWTLSAPEVAVQLKALGVQLGVLSHQADASHLCMLHRTASDWCCRRESFMP